jgi:hypothetical protein
LAASAFHGAHLAEYATVALRYAAKALSEHPAHVCLGGSAAPIAEGRHDQPDRRREP